MPDFHRPGRWLGLFKIIHLNEKGFFDFENLNNSSVINLVQYNTMLICI